MNKALDCVMKCQIDDNGIKSVWCAQHDPDDMLPAEGRPHEMPSFSGSESADLLIFLMNIKNPSKPLQECISAGVMWFESHKYKENAALVPYVNAQGEKDSHIVPKKGCNLWGRFVQIGGESGQQVYQKFYGKLKERNKSRKHHATGFKYKECDILAASYDASKAYQPIFAIYKKQFPELFCRHLYSFEDAPSTTDAQGQSVPTSLSAAQRCKYDYLGDWGDEVIAKYKKWSAKYLNRVKGS